MIKLDLQLFSGEKTEKATPKKRQDARRKGQVVKSQEINSAIVLFLGFAALQLTGSFMLKEIGNYSVKVLSEMGAMQLTLPTLYNLIDNGVLVFVKVTAPVVLLCLAGGLVANYSQVGFLFTTETLNMKLERMNPIEGFGRIFSKRSLVELVKSVLKLVIVAYVAYAVIKGKFDVFPKMLDMDIRTSLVIIAELVVEVGFKSSIILFLLAILDYLYQRYEYEENLKMSKQDIKDEYKQSEGDPLVKAKIREKMRAVAMRRMMQEVPKADVVITNPTHFAVALQYDGSTMYAPVVLAKGTDSVAQKIKEVAKEHDVPVIENKALARALYAATEIGDAVPEDLFHAVAEVLAFVYKLKDKKRR